VIASGYDGGLADLLYWLSRGVSDRGRQSMWQTGCPPIFKTRSGKKLSPFPWYGGLDRHFWELTGSLSQKIVKINRLLNKHSLWVICDLYSNRGLSMKKLKLAHLSG